MAHRSRSNGSSPRRCHQALDHHEVMSMLTRALDATQEAILFLHPLRHPLRLLAIVALINAPKLWIVLTSQPRHFTPSPKVKYTVRLLSWTGIPQWHYGDEWLLYSNLRKVHQFKDVVGWFVGDWVGGNGFYRPLSSLSLLLDYWLWRDGRRGYLFTSWLLQVFAIYLAALLFANVCRDPYSATFGALSLSLVWYPPTIVTLNFMSTRPDALCAPLFMLALLAAIRWCDGGNCLWLIGACAFALFSLWAKESAWMLPLLMLACAALKFGLRDERHRVRCALAASCLALISLGWFIAYLHILPSTVAQYGSMALKPERVPVQAYLISIRVMPQVSNFVSWLISLPHSVLTKMTLRVLAELSVFVALAILSWRHARSALLLSLLWIVVSSLPLMSARLWSPHYFHVPIFGTHMLNGALIAGGLHWLAAAYACGERWSSNGEASTGVIGNA